MKKIINSLISYTVCLLLLVSMSVDAFADNDISQNITDIVYSYRSKPSGANTEMRKHLEDLREKDENLGEIWDTIMRFWIYANEDQIVNTASLPSGITDDDSLCFIVMGFKLNADGSMNEEMKQRCDVALKCAKQYPKAYIAVTGGGTADNTVLKTEADVMHDYLVKNGIKDKRIIVENRSITTCENALYLGDRILKDYPSITSLVIITSDYHVSESSLLFREYMYLANRVNGERDVQVISNMAYKTDMYELADTVGQQSPYVWSIADTFKVIG